MRCPKCCVCSNKRSENVHLHAITKKDQKKIIKWLDCINPHRKCPYSVADVQGKTTRIYVCDVHFERRFVKPNSRLIYEAYPSLFTPDEILRGSPNSAIEDIPKKYAQQPYRARHYDHTYSSTDELAGLAKYKYTYSYVKTEEPPSKVARIDSQSLATAQFKQYVKIEVPPLKDARSDTESLADDTDAVQFSWQNKNQINVDGDDDSIFSTGGRPLKVDKKESEFTEDGEADQPRVKEEKHTEYFCDSCSKEIIGYTCVQCENYDLCGACEARRLHARHYVLRVPGHRPFSEVKSILEAVREKIKFLQEGAQKDSAGLDLEVEDIKLEEPEFEEVSVDPFTDDTTPADDHTSEPPAHTSDETYTMHTDDTTASDTHTSEPREQSKAPVKIVMPTEVLLKAFNKNPLVENTSATHTEPHRKNKKILEKKRSAVSPNMDCHVELTRLPKTTSQTKNVSHGKDEPVMEVTDVERRHFAHKRNQDLKQETYEAVGSDPVIHIDTAVSSNQIESEISEHNCSDVIEDSEVQEYLDEIWLEDETDTTINQKPKMEKNEENTAETQCQEYLSETWLDETLFAFESQYEKSS